jgi:hypothetical protein
LFAAQQMKKKLSFALLVSLIPLLLLRHPSSPPANGYRHLPNPTLFSPSFVLLQQQQQPLSLSLHCYSEYFHYRNKMSALKKRETRIRRKAATIITKLLAPFVAPGSVLSFLGARAPHIARARTQRKRKKRTF